MVGLRAAPAGALGRRAAQITSAACTCWRPWAWRVDTAQGRQILAGAGAQVDDAAGVVRFPPPWSRSRCAWAPKHFSLGARRPDGPAHDAGESDARDVGRGDQVVDRATAQQRRGTRGDWLEATRPSTISTRSRLLGHDRGRRHERRGIADWVAYNADLMRTFSKHVRTRSGSPPGAVGAEGWRSVRHREQVRRVHPYSFLITPVSPLIIEEACTDSWLALRGWDIPVAVLPLR